MGGRFNGAVLLRQQGTPAAPAAGSDAVYAKSDNYLYVRGNTGGERRIVDILGGPQNGAIAVYNWTGGSGTDWGAQLPDPSGFSWMVTCASTGNLTLSGTSQVIDGIGILAGSKVLVKDQTLSKDNGVYIVSAGSWVRTSYHFSTPVYVGSGTVNGSTWFFPITPTGAYVQGTSPMQYTQVGPIVPTQPGAPADPVDGQLYYDDDDNGAALTFNPPAQLTMVENAGAAVATPNTGSLVLFSEDGSILYIKDDSANQRTVGQYQQWLGLITDYATGQPALTAPQSGGGLNIFSRMRARRLPAFVGPTGQDSQLQPALFSNRVATMGHINGVATQQLSNLAVTNNSAPSAVSIATTNFLTTMVRALYPTAAATAASLAGFRSTTQQWFLSNINNAGGFFFVCRFGIGVAAAGSRGFIGLSATNGALSASVDPTTLFNLVGLAWNAADTQFRVISNDASGTATTQSTLSATFSKSSLTQFYEFRLFAPSHGGGGAGGYQVYWSVHELSSGTIIQGGPITTDLPAVNTLLSAHVHYTNGTTAASASLAVQSLYVETDN